MRKPNHFAFSRPAVTMEPSRYGMLMRVSRACWLPASMVVRTSVAARPPAAIATIKPFAGVELAVDASESPAHSRRGGSGVLVPGQEQQAGVDVKAAERARVAAELFAVAESLDLLADERAILGELRDRSLEVVEIVQLQKAVERGPAEHARVREVSALSAHLPDALIRFTPALADQLAKANQLFLRAAIERSSIAHEVQHRADHSAVEVELYLSRGRVANPDWPRAAVP